MHSGTGRLAEPLEHYSRGHAVHLQDEDDEEDEEEESEEEELGPREMPKRTTRGRRMGQVISHRLRSKLHVYRGLGQAISQNAAHHHQLSVTSPHSSDQLHDSENAMCWYVLRCVAPDHEVHTFASFIRRRWRS